jgi:hypothetical protein
VHHGRTGTLLLQGRVREADTARAAHTTGTDAIRERALDPTASCLLGLKLRRQLALPIRDQRLVRLLGPDGQGAPDIPGAWGSIRAIAAVAMSALDGDDIVLTVIDRRVPTEARVPGGTGHLLPIPVDHKAAEGKSALCPGLPAHAGGRRAE